MNILDISIKDLTPYEKNPRNNDKAVKYVAESIKQFGFKVPIIIDKNNVIIAGHTRWKAAKQLKLDKVPCIIADDLTEEQVKAFRIADNKVSEIAEWDLDLLGAELADIINIDMSSLGFDILEEESDAKDDYFNIDDVVASIETPKAKPGEIYKLGNHFLMCGDSTKESDVRKLCGGGGRFNCYRPAIQC